MITEKLLLELGFKEVNVSVEESGSTAFKYFIYEVTDGNTFLISCSDDECDEPDNYRIGFFHEESISEITDGEKLSSFIESLKNLNLL